MMKKLSNKEKTTVMAAFISMTNAEKAYDREKKREDYDIYTERKEIVFNVIEKIIHDTVGAELQAMWNALGNIFGALNEEMPEKKPQLDPDVIEDFINDEVDNFKTRLNHLITESQK